MNLRPEFHEAPQSKVQPLPAEEDSQDDTISEITPPEVSPHSYDVVPQGPEPVIDFPTPPETTVRAALSNHNLFPNPTSIKVFRRWNSAKNGSEFLDEKYNMSDEHNTQFNC